MDPDSVGRTVERVRLHDDDLIIVDQQHLDDAGMVQQVDLASIKAVAHLAALSVAKRRAMAEDRRQRIRSDVREFAKVCWITDPVLGEMPFPPWDWQLNLLHLWATTRLCVVLKARQLGVSWLVAIFVTWVAMFNPSQRILLVSIGQREADKLLEKVAFILRKLPPDIRPRYTSLVRIIRFPDIDSEIESLPSTGGVGRSRSASIVVLDEHAHQDNADAIFVAIEPTVQKGKLLSISTANGVGVLHTRLYKGAAEKANGFQAVFIPWYAHPERDEEWREAERARLNASAQPQLFAQEYPENDIEAFVSTGNPVWTVEDLNRLEPIVKAPEPDFPGLWVYEPPKPDARYVIGADTSEGLETSDWCSATVLRLDKDEEGYRAEQVAQLRGLWAPEVFAQILDRLALRYCEHEAPRGYRTVLLGVERNNHGHAVLLRLRQLNPTDKPYALTFWKKRLGWVTDTQTRPLMFDELAGATRELRLRVHDPATISQMSTFHATKYGGEAQRGYHDDDVAAMAIAWAHHRKAFGVVLDVPKRAA